MKRSVGDWLAVVLSLFMVAGSAGIWMFHQDDPAIRDAVLMGTIVYIGGLLLMKVRGILRCIQGRG